MILRIVFHKEFSRLPGGLEHFADSNSSAKNQSAHHFLSNPDCNNTAEVLSFTLRTALSVIPFV